MALSLPADWANSATLNGSPLFPVLPACAVVFNAETVGEPTVMGGASLQGLDPALGQTIELTDLPTPATLSMHQIAVPLDGQSLAAAYVDPVFNILATNGLSVVNSSVLGNITLVTFTSTHLTLFLTGYSVVSGVPTAVLMLETLMPWWAPLLLWVVYLGLVVYLQLGKAHFKLPNLRYLISDHTALGAALRDVMMYHDWLAFLVWDTYPIVTRHSTVLYVTVMGAMLGNAVLVDTHLDPVSQALIAVLMLMPVRFVISSLFRYAPKRDPRAKVQRPTAPATLTGLNPLGKPSSLRTTKAHGNPLTGPGRARPAAAAVQQPAPESPEGPESDAEADWSGADSPGPELRVEDPLEQQRARGAARPSIDSRAQMYSVARGTAYETSDEDEDQLARPTRASPPSGGSPVGDGKKFRRTQRKAGSQGESQSSSSGSGGSGPRAGSAGPLRPSLRPQRQEGDWEPETRGAPNTKGFDLDQADPWTDARNSLMQRVRVPRPRGNTGQVPELAAPGVRSMPQLGIPIATSHSRPSSGIMRPGSGSLVGDKPKRPGSGSLVGGSRPGSRGSETGTETGTETARGGGNLLDLLRNTSKKKPAGKPLWEDSDSEEEGGGMKWLKDIAAVGKQSVAPGTLPGVQATGLQPDIVKRYLRLGQLIVATHIVLRSGVPTIVEAQRVLMGMIGCTEIEFQKRWDQDEGRCHLWTQALDEVKKHDWHAAKAFFYGSLLSRNRGGMPVGGISPDRMDPWLAFYGEALLGLNEGEFGLLYSAHAGEKVDMKVPVFKGEVVEGTPQLDEWDPVVKPNQVKRRALFVRPTQLPQAQANCDGTRLRPFPSLAEALAAAADNSEVLLLEGHYAPVHIQNVPRNVTIRAAPGAEAVFSGDTGKRGRNGLSWRSGVSREPLLSINNSPLLTVADVHFEFGFVGIRAMNSPDLQVLNCTFKDCKQPTDGDGMSLGQVDLVHANVVTYTTRLSRLTTFRLPYVAVRVGYTLAMAYALLCTVVVLVRNEQLSREYLNVWFLQVVLSLVLDFLLIQFAAAALQWLLARYVCVPIPGRTRFLPPILREGVAQLFQGRDPEPEPPVLREPHPAGGAARGYADRAMSPLTPRPRVTFGQTNGAAATGPTRLPESSTWA
uniref:Uncharacterized protein n=1 Tax=Eutreptiella gymnastica TaxID=73025 RepID=A0A7S1IPA1_9EUGL